MNEPQEQTDARVEAAARAIWRASTERDWDMAGEMSRQVVFDQARAALAAADAVPVVPAAAVLALADEWTSQHRKTAPHDPSCLVCERIESLRSFVAEHTSGVPATRHDNDTRVCDQCDRRMPASLVKSHWVDPIGGLNGPVTVTCCDECEGLTFDERLARRTDDAVTRHDDEVALVAEVESERVKRKSVWRGFMTALTERDVALARVAELEAEVEHWKAHAEEAGAGFSRVCKDYARVSARNVQLASVLDAQAASPSAEATTGRDPFDTVQTPEGLTIWMQAESEGMPYREMPEATTGGEES